MKEQVAEWLMDSRLDDLVRFFEENSPETISKRSIEEQRTIKGALQEELERRISKSNAIKKGSLSMTENLKKVEIDINMLLNLQSRGYNVRESLDQANNYRKAMVTELEKQEKLISEEEQVIDLISSNLKANKYSEHKKRFSDFKLKMKGVPQKICTLNISLLSKMKDSAENKYDELYDELDTKLQKSETVMKYFEDEKDRITKANDELSSIDRYAMTLEAEKRQRKEFKKVKRYARQANILAKLKGGFVRSINIPLDVYEKLEDKYQEKVKAA